MNPIRISGRISGLDIFVCMLVQTIRLFSLIIYTTAHVIDRITNKQSVTSFCVFVYGFCVYNGVIDAGNCGKQTILFMNIGLFMLLRSSRFHRVISRGISEDRYSTHHAFNNLIHITHYIPSSKLLSYYTSINSQCDFLVLIQL